MAEGGVKLPLIPKLETKGLASEAKTVGELVGHNLSGGVKKGTDVALNSIKKLIGSYLKLTVPDFDTNKAQASMERLGATSRQVATAVTTSFNTALSSVINFSNNAGAKLVEFGSSKVGSLVNFCNNAGESLSKSFTMVSQRLQTLSTMRLTDGQIVSDANSILEATDHLENIYNRICKTQSDVIQSFYDMGMAMSSEKSEITEINSCIQDYEIQLNRVKSLMSDLPKFTANLPEYTSGEMFNNPAENTAMFQMEQKFKAFAGTDFAKQNGISFSIGENNELSITQEQLEKVASQLEKDIQTLTQERQMLIGSVNERTSQEFGQIATVQEQLRQANAELSAMKGGKVLFTDDQYADKVTEVRMLTQALSDLRAKMEERVQNTINQELTQLEEKKKALESQRATQVDASQGGYNQQIAVTDQQLKSVEQRLQALRSMDTRPVIDMTVTNQALADAIAKVDELKAKIEEARAQGANESMGGYNDLVSQYDAAVKKVDQLKNGGISATNVFNGLSKAANVVSNGINKANNHLKNMLKLAGRAAASFAKLAGSVTVSSSEMKRGFKRGLKYLLMMVFGVRGLMFAFRKLRNIIVSTIQEMAKSSTEFNAQISETKTLLNTLKGSLGTMAQPLISAVLPAVNAIIQALTQAIILAAKFFAVLSGQNYILKATGAQVDYAKSLEGTGSAAKEAQKSLMGFDEINRLNDDSGGGGGGGNGADFSYEKMGLDPDDAVSKFAEMVKRAWQTGDFFDVGHFLAVKAKGWLDTFNRWLTTTGRSYAMRISNSFATLLNGIFSPDTGLAQTLGETFANLGNVILEAVNHFLTTTRWDDIGLFLGNAIMSGIMHFNWSQLGETVANLLRAGIMTWRGFLDSNFDFSALGTRIGEAINGFFDTMGAIDPNTGMTMWQTLGQNISDSAIGLLDMIIGALDEIDWEQVGTAIGEFLGSIDWKTIFSKLKTVIVKILGGLLSVIKGWFKADAKSALVAGLLVAVMGLGSLFSTIIGLIGQLIPVIGWFITNWAAVAPVLATVGSALMTVASAIGSALLAALPWIAVIALLIAGLMLLVYAINTYGAEVWEVIKEGCTRIVTWIVETATNIWNHITEFLAAAKEVIVIGFTAIVDWVTNIIAIVVAYVQGRIEFVKTIIQTGLNAAHTIITNIVSGIKNFIQSAVSWVQSRIQAGVSAVTGAFRTMKSTIVSIWDGLGSALRGVMNSILTGIGSFVNGGIRLVNGLISAFNNIDIDIPDAIVTAVSEVTGWDIPSSVSFSIPTLPEVSVPQLAKGAVLPPNKPFAAVVGDQKHGTNVEAPLDTIKLAVAEEMDDVKRAIVAGFEALIQTVEEKDMDVRIGDKQIGEAANRYNKKQAIMRGTV